MAVGFTYRHYILKDHLGSWTTITDAEGNVEQELSYDAWGNLRDPETWYNHTQAEPIEAPMFDRGYTGHEHLDAFGLINMNGRLYDPMLGRMLSPDIVVQQTDYTQSYNRYSYCFNNPLRFTDPTGWVVNNYWDPLSKFNPDCIKIGIDGEGNLTGIAQNVNFNTDEASGTWDVRLPFSYTLGYNDPLADNVRGDLGGCVMASNGMASKRLYKRADNSKAWSQKNMEFHDYLVELYKDDKKKSSHPELLYGHYSDYAIQFITWTNNGKYTSYDAEYIELKDIPQACKEKYQILVDVPLGTQRMENGVSISEWHRGVLNSIEIREDGSFNLKFGDPAWPIKYLNDFNGKPNGGILPLPYPDTRFIKIKIKH